MVSPVPKHLRTDAEYSSVPQELREHICNLVIDPSKALRIPGSNRHRAKFSPGLASALVDLAGTTSVGDPMCGTGSLAWETGINAALNDIDTSMSEFLEPLKDRGCDVTYGPAHKVSWSREVCIFSPPYYPRTDRRVPNAHDNKRGAVVGFRDSYQCSHPEFVGNPGGVDAILDYRRQMTEIYSHMHNICERMIVVTKNWMRLGTELRLDIDTILMAQTVGWSCISRHGHSPIPSLWSRFNSNRGIEQGRIGMIGVEDILVFKK